MRTAAERDQVVSILLDAYSQFAEVAGLFVSQQKQLVCLDGRGPDHVVMSLKWFTVATEEKSPFNDVLATQQPHIGPLPDTPQNRSAMSALGSSTGALLLIPLNWPARFWALPALAIAAIYPFTKRFFSIPQAILGVAFSMGIPMAFAVVRGEVPLIVAWLMLANFFWVLAFDTEYAMVDRDDDIRIGIRTSALFFGRFDVLAVAGCYAAFIAMMVLIGNAAGLGPIYYFGLTLAGEF